MATSSKKSKIITRLRSRKPFIESLPSTILHKIYSYLDILSLQEFSVTNKRLRQTVISIPDRALLLPLVPRHSPAIEVEITKTLVIKSALFNKKWLDTVFIHFNQVTIIEIATNDITSRYKIRELLRSISDHSISKILIPTDCFKKWTSIYKSMPKGVKVIIQTLPDNYYTKRRDLIAINQTAEENELLFPFIPALPIASQYKSWMSPVEEMVSKFNQFQKESITLFQKKGKVYNTQQVLSLSNVFLFSPDSYREYKINMKQWHAMLYNCRDGYNNPQAIISVSETGRINEIINEFAHQAYRDLGNLQEYVSKIKLYDINTNVIRMLENISYKCKYDSSGHKVDEDTHTINYIDPVINAFLDNTIPNLTYRGCGYELLESKLRKIQQANTHGDPIEKIQGRRPDRSAHIFTFGTDGVYNLYLSEIKTESESQGRPDLAKLGIMMKDCLDHALIRGAPMDKYNIIGLLIEGRMCTVYILDLIANGLYRMIEMDIFSLSTSIKDLNLLSFVYQPLLNIRAQLIKNSQLLIDLQPDLSIEEKHAVESHLRKSCKSPAHYTEFYE